MRKERIGKMRKGDKYHGKKIQWDKTEEKDTERMKL